jgi:hypothetical protein
METQNSETTAHSPKDAAKKPPRLLRATVKKLIDMLAGWQALDKLLVFDEIPVLIPPKLKTDFGLDSLPETCDQVRKNVMLQPDVPEPEAVDYQASAMSENFEQLGSTYPDSPLRMISVWLLAVLAILWFLSLMLTVGIAISV